MTSGATATPITKAISLESRLAEAVAMWGQWIITSPRPPAGNLAPPGATSAPGEPIDRGERIAIHSADGQRLVATAVVFNIALIGSPYSPGLTRQSGCGSHAEVYNGRLYQRTFETSQPASGNLSWGPDVSDQLLLGNIVPGRWVWLLSGVEMLEQPIPCDGGDGVWPLPDDIAEQLASPKEAV